MNDGSGNFTSDDFASGGGDVTDAFTYDAFHQLDTKSRSGLYGLSTRLGYDSQHNVNAVVPNGSPGTMYQYDDFGRVASESSTLSGNWAYAYDPDGDLTSETDPNSSVTTRTYDALNRPLTAVSKKASSTESVSWTYDSTTSGAYGIGRLAKMTDPTGSTTYSYEPRGLLVQKSQVVNNATYATNYAYDSDGDLATVGLPSGRSLTYGYDYAHRPTSVSGTLSGTTTHYVTGALYLPFGPRTQLTYGNGTTQTFTYNQRYLPYEDKVISAAGTLSDVAYAENNLGEITQANDILAPTYNRTSSYGGSSLPQSMLAGVTTGSSLWGSSAFAGPAQGSYANGEDLSSESLGSTALGLPYDTN